MTRLVDALTSNAATWSDTLRRMLTAFRGFDEDTACVIIQNVLSGGRFL